MGMFIGPLLGGLIGARFGFQAVFLTIGALTLANFAWVLFYGIGTKSRVST